MRIKLLLFILVFLSAFVISACGSDDEKSEDTEANAEAKEEEQEDKDDGEQEEVEEEDDEEESDDQAEASDSDFSELITYMEEETEGEAEVLFENNEKQEHELDGVNVSLDAYTLVELKDFHTNFSIPFNDQTDGGVILAQYTVENTTDDDVFYMPALDMSYTGATKYFSNYKDLLPEEEQLPTMLSPSEDYLLEAGDTVTGYFTYPLGQDILDEVLDLSTVSITVPPAQAEKGEFGNPIGSEGKFQLALNEDGADNISENEKFYQDKATFENMGDKEMIKEKSDIGEKEDIGDDYVVELEGYQFTEFTPNSEEAPRFSNFENGIVLLTVKFIVENNGSENIDLSGISSKLTVNDGAQWLLNEGMLLNYNRDLIEPDETDELLQIFVLDQEQYEKIWKEKDFEIEVGPMKDENYQDISKGKVAEFILPK